MGGGGQGASEGRARMQGAVASNPALFRSTGFSRNLDSGWRDQNRLKAGLQYVPGVARMSWVWRSALIEDEFE